MWWDLRALILMAGVLVLLGIATAVVHLLRNREDSGLDTAIVETFRLRVRAWWVLFSILAAALLMRSPWATVVLFWLISFWALREFITLTPTRPGDHRTLFWVFFLLTPLQFFLVGMGWYGLYSILIPVYAFLFIPARIALAGDYKRFLERTAKIQAGLLVCVYCLSYAPALLTMVPQTPLPSGSISRSVDPADNGQPASPGDNPLPAPPQNPASPSSNYSGAALLVFFVLIVQFSDALQYIWAQIPSKHVIVPTINSTKTWEGLLGGTASVTLIGATLWWATPFQGWYWWRAAAVSTVTALMGFAGSLTLSAIKRDRGVKDYGTLVEGHGGVLDRIDSLCFAAPVFFHLTRWWLPT
jgi:phosphatidate cytidylyltransferase